MAGGWTRSEHHTKGIKITKGEVFFAFVKFVTLVWVSPLKDAGGTNLMEKTSPGCAVFSTSQVLRD